MGKFDDLETDLPAYAKHLCIERPSGAGLCDHDYLPGILLSADEWRDFAKYWRTMTARAELRYSDAYWHWENSKDMEGHCLFMAETLEAQALAGIAEKG